MKDLRDAEAEIKTTHELSDYTDESVGRYMAYTARLRSLLTSVTRYIAYSSEVGEAFRPLARPAIVTAAYGISWAYIFGDVGYACYHASKVLDPRDSSYTSDIAWIAARRATFQTLARTAVVDCTDPFSTAAFTIHTVVHYSSGLFKVFRNARVRSMGPTALGLFTVPALPYIYDHPVEHGVENFFDWLEALVVRTSHPEQTKEQALGRSKGRSDVIHNSEKQREVDRIGTPESPDAPLSLSPTPDGASGTPDIAKAAILGVGVDLVCLPRVGRLVSRHASRIAEHALRPAVGAAPSELRSPSERKERVQPTPVDLATAAQHFARRILSDSEAQSYQAVAPRAEDHIRFLATRWAAKEAAYKSLFPHVRLAPRDLTYVRRTDSIGERPTLLLDDRVRWGAARARDALQLHLSMSHDGDYVVAYVLAESA